MAKKKQPSKFYFLKPPYSVKAIIGTGVIFAALFIINTQSLHRYQKEETDIAIKASKNILTQMGKQNVLGSSTTTRTTDEDASFKKRSDVSYWLTISQQKPDYRDAHLMLAVLAYNDHRCTFAQQQMAEAYQIDPKGVTELPLTQTISSCETGKVAP